MKNEPSTQGNPNPSTLPSSQSSGQIIPRTRLERIRPDSWANNVDISGLGVTQEKSVNPIFSADFEGKDLRDTLKEYTKTEAFKENLTAKIKILFPDDSEKVSIENYKSPDSHNYESHKIVICGDKKFHFKPAFQTKNYNAGSKYNELFYYKMCQELGIGPECHGIIMEDSGALFILTEDLSTRNIKGSPKEISFATRRADLQNFKKLPSRDIDNIHRVALNLAILLMDLDDLKSNQGNIGIKTSKNLATSEVKEKIFLVDFLTNELPGIFQTDELMNDFFKSFNELLKTETADKLTRHSDFFIPSSLTQNSIKTAIQKLFVDKEGNPTKMLEAIDKSYDYSLSLLNETNYQTREGLALEDDKKIHRDALLRRVNKQRAIIEEFMQIPEVKQCIDEKVREIKLKESIDKIATSNKDAPAREAPPILRIVELKTKGRQDSSSPSPSTQSGSQTVSASPVSRTDSPSLMSPPS